MSQLYFNHQLCRSSSSVLQEKAMPEAYHTLYAFAGAEHEDHFIFTSSGAEAVNHAIFSGYLDITRKTGKNHFLCSSLDEAPAIMAMSRLQELGCVFQMVAAEKEGYVTAKAVAEMFTPRTAMLSISWVNALTGVIQPLQDLSALCRERGVLFHVDATHALGKGDFSFAQSGADLLTFSTPYAGMGGMFIRNGIEISPLILGGLQQGHLRGGPFSASALIECAKWAKEEQAASDHYGMEIARLRTVFEQKICEELPGVQVLFQKQQRVPHITSFLFPSAASETLCFALHRKGVHATYGGNDLQYFANILKACHLTGHQRHTALSFAFAHTTTEEEVMQGSDKIVTVVRQLQKYSEHLMRCPV